MKSLLITFSTLILIACTNSKTTPEEYSKKWTDETRTYIIQSNVLSDKKNLGKFIQNTLKGLNTDNLTTIDDECSTEIYTAEDSSMQYIKIRRSNGMLCFKGILINNALFGTAEWYNKLGYWDKVGHYYNNQPCGKWKYYSDSLKIDSIIDKGNSDLLLNFKTEEPVNK